MKGQKKVEEKIGATKITKEMENEFTCVKFRPSRRCYYIVSWLLVDVFVRCVSLTLFFDEENPRALSWIIIIIKPVY